MFSVQGTLLLHNMCYITIHCTSYFGKKKFITYDENCVPAWPRKIWVRSSYQVSENSVKNRSYHPFVNHWYAYKTFRLQLSYAGDINSSSMCGDFEQKLGWLWTPNVHACDNGSDESVVDKTVNISLDTTQYLENDSNLCSNCLFSVLLRVKIAEITSQLMRLL